MAVCDVCDDVATVIGDAPCSDNSVKHCCFSHSASARSLACTAALSLSDACTIVSGNSVQQPTATTTLSSAICSIHEVSQQNAQFTHSMSLCCASK
jgi:hypothetical protein